MPGMAERGFGRVLFMSSVAGLTGGIVGPHYAASKAGLHGLTHYLARRAAGEGVTVNALAPALIEDTGMLPGDPGALATMIPVEPGQARGGRRPGARPPAQRLHDQPGRVAGRRDAPALVVRAARPAWTPNVGLFLLREGGRTDHVRRGARPGAEGCEVVRGGPPW